MPKPPATPERCVELWIKYHEEHDTMPRSITDYRLNALRAIAIFKANAKETLPYKWKEKDLRWIKKYWENNHIKPNGERSGPLAVKTIKVYMCTISLLAAHYKNNVGKEAKMRYRQDVRPNVDWLEYEDILKILGSNMNPMQRLAFNFEAQIGMRRIDIIRMKNKMIDFKHGLIEVDGKGHKARTVYFHRDTPDALEKYLAWKEELRQKAIRHARKHHTKFVDSDYLLVYRQGSKLLPYSEKGTGFDKQFVQKLTKLTGIKIKNHTLRRTWGREAYYRGGMDIVDIAAVYGHSNIITTLKYIGADEKRVRAAMDKLPY